MRSKVSQQPNSTAARPFFSKTPRTPRPFFPSITTSPNAPAIQREFVGTDKKKVEMEKKDGKIVFKGKNVPADLKALVDTINASGSSTAVDQVLKTSKNKSKIHVKIEDKVIDNNKYGTHKAHDSKGKPLNWDNEKNDFDGKPAYVEEGVYKEATIIIYKGNLIAGGGNKEDHEAAGVKLTLEQLIAGVFAHETAHNTDKEFISDLRNRREGKPDKDIDAHDNITPLEQKIYGEIGAHQKEQDKKKKKAEEKKKEPVKKK